MRLRPRFRRPWLRYSLICVMLAGSAQAAPSCGDPANKKAFTDEHGERRIGSGLVTSPEMAGTAIELTVNPESGRWSILVTSPNGTTCLAAYGEAWGIYPLPANM